MPSKELDRCVSFVECYSGLEVHSNINVAQAVSMLKKASKDNNTSNRVQVFGIGVHELDPLYEF